MIDTEIEKLITLAHEARACAYSPYSEVTVGAALLCKNGKIYLGANIENAAYSPGICAERVAFSKAIYDGERDFAAIAVVGGAAGENVCQLFSPCGVCRQVMAEFCSSDFTVIMTDGNSIKTVTLGELFPLGFGKDNL